MPIPAIAIHRAGPSDRIARGLDSSFKNSGNPVTTLAFDFGRVNQRPNYSGLRNLYRFSRQNAANITSAAHMGLEFGAHPLDAQLGAWQIRLHRVLQGALAALVAVIAVRWLTNLLVVAPAAWYGLPPAAFSPIRWLGIFSEYLKLAVGGGVTLLIVMGGLRLLLTLSPRPVIITFRSIVLLLLQPVLIVTTGLVAVNVVPLATLAAGVTAISLLTGGTAAILPALLALGTLVATRILWERGPLRRVIEGLYETFRYLGEPEYRQRVQEALDRAIARARERAAHDREFVLAGQGLGSMIALDSVLHSRVWRHTDRVVLVTAGSPLSRYFLTLYPRTLFPESMEDVVDLIAGRLEEFRWLNIYHRGDVTGGELGLKPFNGLDIATARSGPVPLWRAEYWQCVEARRALHDGLQRLREVEPLRVPMRDAAHRLLDPADTALTFSVPPRFRPALRAGLALGAFGWMAWWVATGSGLLASTADTTPEVLVQSGVTVDASATHRRETVRGELGLTFVDSWTFAFTDPNGAGQTIDARYDASDAFLGIRPPRFDDRAVSEQVRAGCMTGWPARWWKLTDASQACTIEGLRLRYYPGDLSLFDLPDYPRQRFGGNPVSQWTEAGVVAAILAPLFLVPLVVGARLFLGLSGLREAETETRAAPSPAPARPPARAPARRPVATGST